MERPLPYDSLRGEIFAHYTRLDIEARTLRFMNPIPDAALVKLINQSHNALVVPLWDQDNLRGVCEVHLSPTNAEIGISLEAPLRGRGLGRQLLKAGLNVARIAGSTCAEFFFASDNTAMNRLLTPITHVERFGNERHALISL